MSDSVLEIKRPVRRRLKRVVQRHRDGDYRRRARAILALSEGKTVSETARQLCATRKSVRSWRERFRAVGEQGLVPRQRGRPAETVTEEVCAKLLELVAEEPTESGYLGGTWNSQMLAEQLREQLKIFIHSSTVRRLLPSLGVVWKRARPTLCIKDPKKASRMKAIKQALAWKSPEHPVFYVDEVDIDLNPRIGFAWSKKGQQTTVPTPGRNEKRYLAGALNAATGTVVWVEWPKKNAEIFIRLLRELKRRYRRAKTITLIADNYVIHKSRLTGIFLEHNPKLRLLFQPVYHPWVNRIERLWKKLHDTVTRNHRYPTMNKLMHAVRTFMDNTSPFPAHRPNTLRVVAG